MDVDGLGLGAANAAGAVVLSVTAGVATAGIVTVVASLARSLIFLLAAARAIIVTRATAVAMMATALLTATVTAVSHFFGPCGNDVSAE